MKNMRIVFLMVLLPALAALPLDEPRVPRNADEVARPGGKLPGNVRIALVKVAENFYDPTNVASANDGSGRIFVVERVGRVKIVHKDGRVQKEPFLDLTNINPLGTDVQTGFVEQGLYSIAFHPRFKENGYFYVHYASLPFNGDGVIVRFQADPKSPNIMTPERTRQTSKVLLRIEQPYYNHNGGQIDFGPDGYLYIGSGDGGWEGDPLEAGQDLSTLLGKILRIDVNTSDDDRIPYKIPPANPFAVASAERLMQLFGISELDFSKIKMRARREIWAYGLRNPYEFSFDLKTGNLYIADVGQKMPSGGRAAGRGISAPDSLPGRSSAQRRLGLFGRGIGRGQLRRHEGHLPGGRLVLGPRLRPWLGRETVAVGGIAPDEPAVHGGRL